MKKYVKNSVFYIFIGISTLLGGLIVYLIFGPNTYVSKFVFELVQIKPATPPGGEWIRFYAADFLWAFSLSCFIYAIYLPNTKNAITCSAVVMLVGIVYEIMQYFKVISGTGDVVDVLFYLLAASAVNIINFIRRKKNEEQKNY